MTSTTTRQQHERTQPGPRLRASRTAAHALVAVAVALAAWTAGLALRDAALVAAVAALLTLLLPAAPATATAPATAPPGVAAAEVRRSETAQLLQLELAVDRLRSVLESLREGVIVVDGGGEVVMVNPEARPVLREPSNVPVGRPLRDVLAPELSKIVGDEVAGLIDGLGEPDDDAPIRVPAIPFGARVLDLTAVRVRSRESGQDFGAVLLFVDATRNHELARLKDRFLSAMSHELRTPLTNLCSYTEILRHLVPGEDPQWPDFVRIVHEESLDLNRLIDTIFRYAELESGQVKFDLATVDGGELVRAACDRARATVAQKGIRLECECAADLPSIHVDAGHFAHVCDQLLDNAVKFTPREGTVRAEATLRGGSFCLRIEDSGRGIERSLRDQVFQKFTQLSDMMTDKPDGLGLGLATSREIVTRMGGTIRCEESPLGGAAFVVVLPAARAQGDGRGAATVAATGHAAL